MSEQDFWQPYLQGPTGTTGPLFLGVTGAVTGPAFFGVTGASGPTAGTEVREHEHIKYLYDRVRIEMVGASDAMIRSTIYEVLHEFFNDSSCWMEAIPGTFMPGVVYYYMEPGNPQSLLTPYPKGRIIGLAGVVDYNHFPLGGDMPEPPVLRLQFAQSNPLPGYVTVIKNVESPRGSELPRVPHWVVQTYETWLKCGVVGKLQMQAEKPYSDSKLGMLNYQTFRQGVNIARVRTMRSNTLGTNAWVYPQQFRSVSQRGGVSVGNDRVF